ncbi:MAG: Cu(I)/Ag(I) efflux system membrane fusion protein [Flavobacteriales bacterium]|jgi:Cu(I)/Ag(I) efflux system membrane fusion protein
MNKLNTMKRRSIIAAVGGLIFGVLVGVIATLTLGEGGSGYGETVTVDKKPLYWVAPMDANYRRDKPGKSPMGMDLIAFYDSGEKANDAGPGTVNVSPDVINNLGVRVGTAVRKPLHSEIVTVGYVQYDENRLVHIHPRVSGWVEKLYVKAAGDPVKKGEALYSLYSPELVNAQEELVLAVNRKNIRLVHAAEDRLRALQISNDFIKTLKRTLLIKQAVNFYAPQSGVIDNLNIREGFFVKPGTTMLSIGALDRVWVGAEIFERQGPLVALNDPVTMTLDYLPGRTWTGKVEYIYPTLDSKTRTLRIRLSFDNPKRELKPNMFAQVTVHADSEDQLLVIPREALIRTGSQDRVVLALGEGSFKSVEVKVGRTDQFVAEILEGVKENEKIVISAQFLLDSESSKTSDFKRMNHGDDRPSSVWVAGEILSIMTDIRMASVKHDVIEAWGRPAMIMNFTVSTKVDIDSLADGERLQMEIRKLDNGKFEISGVRIQTKNNNDTENNVDELEKSRNAVNDGGDDHSTMNHKQMNHKQMNHKQMNHKQMNHGDDKTDHSPMNHEGMTPSKTDPSTADPSTADPSTIAPSKIDPAKVDHSMHNQQSGEA